MAGSHHSPISCLVEVIKLVIATEVRDTAGVHMHARTHAHAHTHIHTRTHAHAPTHARTHAHTSLQCGKPVVGCRAQ